MAVHVMVPVHKRTHEIKATAGSEPDRKYQPLKPLTNINIIWYRL